VVARMTSDALTPKQRLFVQALISHGGDVSRAADAVGVGRSTAFRWVALEAVTQALCDLDREAIRTASRRLAQLGAKAVVELEKIIDDPKTTTATKVRALDIALARMLQVAELVDQNDRLTALEAALADQEDQHGQARRSPP